MTTVTFLPAGRTVQVDEGTALLDAATTAGVLVEAPCGGEGTCGECRLRVEAGAVEQVRAGCLSNEELEEGWVLACSSRVAGDVTVTVPEEPEEARGPRVAGREVDGRPAEAGIEPFARRVALDVEPPSLENSFSDLERLERAADAGTLGCGLQVLRELAAALRSEDGRVTATISGGRLLRVQAGDTVRSSHGVAVDIGTTTCAVHLVELARGRIVGTAADYNGQIARGLDIISRINYARTPGRLDELRGLVLGTLNGLVGGLCRSHQVEPGDVDGASVAGNTTMVHLLLGLDPEQIRLEPYTPTVNRPPALPAREVGLEILPAAPVCFAPGVGSYVGGDITAGLLTSSLATDDEGVALFLDIGTNGEVVVGNNEWLMACAASAGPAFEGSGVSCGVRAASGAVERVVVDGASGRARVSVIGGGKARGICGSGMIDLLAELAAHGLLDPSGKLNPDRCPADRLRRDGRTLGYVVVDEGDSATGEALVIDENDLQNLLRTKAAIYSACSLMLRSVGLGFDDVTRVHVAGAFGRYLDLERSIRIGLLPDVPRDRFVYLGNAALAGAHALLTSARARDKVAELADRMTYLELNVDPSYMDEYMAALFLPHTDLDRFPSLKGGKE
jgi:uncharacterized 2Fe-2S/4Fe-4S cluster protein (DUF4445 family)